MWDAKDKTGALVKLDSFTHGKEIAVWGLFENMNNGGE